MQQVQVLDKSFELLHTAQEIQRHVKKLGKKLATDYAGKDPVFIVLLNGAFIFAADLLRQVTIPATISFVRIASYQGLTATGNLKTVFGITDKITGRHIIIIDDILDTGQTLSFLKNELLPEAPLSVKTVVCFRRKIKHETDRLTDYVCLEIEEGFVIGYGLDYNGYGRHLKDIYRLK